MFSRTKNNHIVCVVVEIDNDEALISIQANEQESVHWIVPVNFIPLSAREVGLSFRLQHEFINIGQNTVAKWWGMELEIDPEIRDIVRDLTDSAE